MSSTYTTAPNQISTKDLRNQLASVVDRVALRGESFVVTKFGQPRAMVVPIAKKSNYSVDYAQLVLRESQGIWEDRPETTKSLTRELRLKAERSNKTA